ncbi:MFS transporter [Novosphingobium sp. KACC 22771]|uniref:MFS transporter n=1 Tax=Novosphingobium sp. KACC 22771 TaxID=3025670 RepID=UPI002366BBE1|nr:MFS transporter [Novosphingobium sp. KACC 22771]WDF74373.1 MFS transporter [Novosphingobium sp. KACC 22771]
MATGVAGRASGPFIAAYWIAQCGNWLGLITPVTLTIAIRLAEIADPARKMSQLGLVLGVGALASIIATPIWGHISDHTSARIGRRKLWMIVGVAGGGAGLLLMSATHDITLFGLGWVIAQIGFNANQAALNALLPDKVPEAQRGRVSGLLGLTIIVAVVLGTFLTQFTADNAYLLFLAPWLGTVLSLAMILPMFQDSPAPAFSETAAGIGRFLLSFRVDPREHPDFYWAWLSRFLVVMGIAYLQAYSVYFLSDRLKQPMSEVPRLIFINGSIGAVITLVISPAAGWLSDRMGRRKPFVFVAAVIGAAGLVATGMAQSVIQFLIGSAIAGIGISVYYAVDLALVAAVLPDPDSSAKDMGIFQIANTLPQSLAPVIAPAFLVIGGVPGGNYPAVFIAASAFALLGAVAIMPIKKIP